MKKLIIGSAALLLTSFDISAHASSSELTDPSDFDKQSLIRSQDRISDVLGVEDSKYGTFKATLDPMIELLHKKVEEKRILQLCLNKANLEKQPVRAYMGFTPNPGRELCKIIYGEIDEKDNEISPLKDSIISLLTTYLGSERKSNKQQEDGSLVEQLMKKYRDMADDRVEQDRIDFNNMQEGEV